MLGVLAWLGHRYPDELFDALGDPRFVTPSVACTIEPIDDPRTAPILLAAVDHDDDAATTILLPGLVRRRDERVVPLLERALFSTNRALRVRAAEGPLRDGTADLAPTRCAPPSTPSPTTRCARSSPTRWPAQTTRPTTRDLSWFWVVVRPRLGEYGVAAFDADDALIVLAPRPLSGPRRSHVRGASPTWSPSLHPTPPGSTRWASPPSAACGPPPTPRSGNPAPDPLTRRW